MGGEGPGPQARTGTRPSRNGQGGKGERPLVMPNPTAGRARAGIRRAYAWLDILLGSVPRGRRRGHGGTAIRNGWACESGAVVRSRPPASVLPAGHRFAGAARSVDYNQRAYPSRARAVMAVVPVGPWKAMPAQSIHLKHWLVPLFRSFAHASTPGRDVGRDHGGGGRLLVGGWSFGTTAQADVFRFWGVRLIAPRLSGQVVCITSC